MSLFDEIIECFETGLDFLRFGVSESYANGLYYGHGADNALDDVLALVLQTLNLPPASDVMMLNARLLRQEKVLLAGRLQKRIEERVPVPYLTNKAYFCGLEFFVDERVLIPRSPIAELIENQFNPWLEEDKVNNVLDLCTGSACIAIACSYAFPDAEVDAVDISARALEVAQCNVSELGVEESVNLIESDLFSTVAPKQYDLIVSNPPYVGTDEMAGLPSEYLHEPQLALEASDDGLALVEKILRKARDYLAPQGVLIVEVGNSEHALVMRYPQVPFTWLEFERGGSGVFLLTKEQLTQHF